MSNIIVGLDIGTSFVRVVVGEININNEVEIVGVSKKPTSGLLRNGVIVNIEATTDCIKEVIHDAEVNAGYDINSCVIGIGGAQIEGMNSKGQVAVTLKGKNNREISKVDVDRVLEAANAVNIPLERCVLHLIPQEYIIDGIGGYKDPVNNIGVRLEAEVHIITASKGQIQNISTCIERTGLFLQNVMLKTLAATQAVMLDEEKDLGSILIDLGGGTTDVLVVHQDAPVCTLSIPVGGNMVTSDIAIVKGISLVTAEKLKLESGCCWEGVIDSDAEDVIIPGVGGREPELISRLELCNIIQARVAETLTMVRDEIIHKSNLSQLSGSIILTGGGAQMSGIVELTESIFGTSAVRIGMPGKLGGIEEAYRSPEYATAVGLVLANKDTTVAKTGKKEKKHRDADYTGSGESIWQKFKKMFF